MGFLQMQAQRESKAWELIAQTDRESFDENNQNSSLNL